MNIIEKDTSFFYKKVNTFFRNYNNNTHLKY